MIHRSSDSDTPQLHGVASQPATRNEHVKFNLLSYRVTSLAYSLYDVGLRAAVNNQSVHTYISMYAQRAPCEYSAAGLRQK